MTLSPKKVLQNFACGCFGEAYVAALLKILLSFSVHSVIGNSALWLLYGVVVVPLSEHD